MSMMVGGLVLSLTPVSAVQAISQNVRVAVFGSALQEKRSHQRYIGGRSFAFC
jgi:hypothetical protein